MRLIDADELKKDDEVTQWLSLNAVRTGKMLKMFSELFVKKIDDAPTIQAVPIEVLQEIRQEIESNMETITGTYDASTPEYNMPSHKIERNFGRKECIAIIDKHIKEIE